MSLPLSHFKLSILPSFTPCETGELTKLCYSAGIPHVLLPVWMDCFDFGNRVELLGIGRWASKKATPRWKRHELASSLQEVLFGEQAEAIRDKARALGKAHPEHAGRDNAARELLGMLQA